MNSSQAKLIKVKPKKSELLLSNRKSVEDSATKATQIKEEQIEMIKNQLRK